MTIAQALALAYKRLRQAQVPDWQLDAQWLLADLLKVKRLALTLMQDQLLDAALQADYESRLARRERREPLQYILGTAEFMGHRLFTHPQVLIPRNDTETLAQLAIRRIKPGHRVLDLCCGSGCLAIAIKMACPGALVWASDLSEEAIRLTRKNASHLGAEITLALGHLFEPLRGQRFDLIVSNPPYIPQADMQTLQAEVGYEPALALAGGEDGLDFFRAILAQAPFFLNPGGYLMLELGDGQAKALHALLPAVFHPWQMARDLQGLTRAAQTRLMD